MTWVSKITTAFGLILLFHACYSAHEVSGLQSHRAASLASLTASPPGTTTSLPLDIIIETIVATFTVCLGMVLGTSRLRPIQWRVWAGQIEREGEAGFKNSSGELEKHYVGNPFRLLESRPGFVNIIQQRRDFAEWVKATGQ
ncbi:magnesium transporter [Xylariaceae sp. FL0662B]|nr:magnesium transporter [Xylariaceae sp. FL0662B]